jgi:hypothetical protein
LPGFRERGLSAVLAASEPPFVGKEYGKPAGESGRKGRAGMFVRMTFTAATTLNAALGAPATPDAVSRMLSRQTPMASQMPRFLSIHNPAAPTRSATPTATAKKTTIDGTRSPLGTAFAHNGTARWNGTLDSASRTAATVTV